MAAKIRPLGDKILLKRVEAESVTKSGIVLPEAAKEKPKRGKIIAVGDGKLLDNGERAKFQVKKGDEVIFASYAGSELKVDGEEFLILSEDEVLAGPDNVFTPYQTLRSCVAQNVLVNLYTGIAAGALDEARKVTLHASRPWLTSGVERAAVRGRKILRKSLRRKLTCARAK